MPGGLPSGLITNTEIITEEIDNTERVQVEDLAKLWRVYSLNSTHMQDDEATRLENFFWRIWSNGRIIRSIRGSTLARLFITISEGGDRVRTTPVPTPLSATPTQSVTFPSAATPRLNVSRVSPEEHEQHMAEPGPVDAAAPVRRTCDQSRTLPPILKKTRGGSNDPLKPAKMMPLDSEKRDAKTTTVRRESSESVGVSSEKGLKNVARKKTSFASAGGNRKVRPGVMRKRSSQTSAFNEQRKTAQTSPLTGAQSGKTTPKSATGLPPALATAAFALPSSSWQDVDSPSSSRTSADNAFATPQQPSSWLVDKNFRGKFVEEQKRATSSVNLAALGKSQSVRFLDEMPEHRKRAEKNVAKAKAGETGRDERPKQSRGGGGPQLPSSMAIGEDSEDEADDDDEEEEEDTDDDDDGSMPALPRTKSQLSVLIDKERQHRGNVNLGPETPRQENRPGKEDQDKHDKQEENELLVMARRDRKLIAEDPDQPFKAAAKKGLLTGGSKGGDTPGSPPPVF